VSIAVDCRFISLPDRLTHQDSRQGARSRHPEGQRPQAAGIVIARAAITMLVADALSGREEEIRIDSCEPLERLVVKTRNSVYDLVVVSGREGEVLVRGGRLFPEFRQAQLVGASAGGHTLKLFGVHVGLCLELFVDHRSVVTSPVLEISRPAA
jgi:hypothetical protein